MFPIIGGPIIAIIAGMIITMFWNNKGKAAPGIKVYTMCSLDNAGRSLQEKGDKCAFSPIYRSF